MKKKFNLKIKLAFSLLVVGFVTTCYLNSTSAFSSKINYDTNAQFSAQNNINNLQLSVYKLENETTQNNQKNTKTLKEQNIIFDEKQNKKDDTNAQFNAQNDINNLQLNVHKLENETTQNNQKNTKTLKEQNIIFDEETNKKEKNIIFDEKQNQKEVTELQQQLIELFDNLKIKFNLLIEYIENYVNSFTNKLSEYIEQYKKYDSNLQHIKINQLLELTEKIYKEISTKQENILSKLSYYEHYFYNLEIELLGFRKLIRKLPEKINKDQAILKQLECERKSPNYENYTDKLKTKIEKNINAYKYIIIPNDIEYFEFIINGLKKSKEFLQDSIDFNEIYKEQKCINQKLEYLNKIIEELINKNYSYEPLQNLQKIAEKLTQLDNVLNKQVEVRKKLRSLQNCSDELEELNLGKMTNYTSLLNTFNEIISNLDNNLTNLLTNLNVKIKILNNK